MARLSVAALSVMLALVVSVFGARHNQELASFMLSNYDARVFPDFVEAKIGIMLKRIVELDTDKHTLTLDTWFELYWNDDRLKWDDYAKFADLESIALPAPSVWIPDVMLYNSVDGYTTFDEHVNVIVSKDGSMTYIPPMTFHSACDVGDDYESTGTAFCALTFGSWVHSLAEMDLNIFHPQFQVDDVLVGDGHWSYVNSTSVRNEMKYACCPEVYVTVVFTIEIQRND